MVARAEKREACVLFIAKACVFVARPNKTGRERKGGTQVQVLENQVFADVLVLGRCACFCWLARLDCFWLTGVFVGMESGRSEGVWSRKTESRVDRDAERREEMKCRIGPIP